MDFEAKSGDSSFRRRSSRRKAISKKTSTLILMPWEKRHQNSMTQFMMKTHSPDSTINKDSRFYNANKTRKGTFVEAVINCSRDKDHKLNNSEKKTDAQKDIVMTQDNGCGSVNSSVCIQSNFDFKSKERIVNDPSDCNSALLKEKTQLNRCNFKSSHVPNKRELSSDMRREGGKQIINCKGTQFEEPDMKDGTVSGITGVRRSTTKYNLNAVFKYEKVKDGKPLLKRLTDYYSISKDLNDIENATSEEGIKTFPKRVRNPGNYSMEEIFTYNNCRMEKPFWQRLDWV